MNWVITNFSRIANYNHKGIRSLDPKHKSSPFHSAFFYSVGFHYGEENKETDNLSVSVEAKELRFIRLHRESCGALLSKLIQSLGLAKLHRCAVMFGCIIPSRLLLYLLK